MATYEITPLDSILEFDTLAAHSISSDKVPGKDWVVVCRYRTTSLPYLQVFEKNTSSGAMSALGSPVDLGDGPALGTATTSVVCIDSSNVFVAWADSSSDGRAQLYTIDGSGNLSANGSNIEYDTSNATTQSAKLYDSTNICIAWEGSGNDGFIQFFSIDTGAGTITPVGTAFEYDTTQGRAPSMSFLNKSGTPRKIFVGYVGASTALTLKTITFDSGLAITGADGEITLSGTLELSNVKTCSLSESSQTGFVLYEADRGGGRKVYGRTLLYDGSNMGYWGSEFEISSNTGVNFEVGLDRIDENNVLVCCGGMTYPTIYSLNIDGSGDISIVDSVVFWTTSTSLTFPSLCNFGDGTFTVFLGSGGPDGFCRGYSLSTISTSNGNFFMFM